jgi:hypothetical protein
MEKKMQVKDYLWAIVDKDGNPTTSNVIYGKKELSIYNIFKSRKDARVAKKELTPEDQAIAKIVKVG